MSAQPTTDTILIGNSFPVSLIRTKVIFEPQPLTALQAAVAGKRIYSYWGHPNTLAAASQFVGADLTPMKERPSLQMTSQGMPVLDGQAFEECWVLSPNHGSSARPSIGEELDPHRISEWHVLKLTWPSAKKERKP
jgi:hypothetical protein